MDFKINNRGLLENSTSGFTYRDQKKNANENPISLATLRITGCLKYFHYNFSLFKKLENSIILKLDLFPPSAEGRESSSLLGCLGRATINH
jgi:hypothetical protein